MRKNEKKKEEREGRKEAQLPGKRPKDSLQTGWLSI